MASGINFSGLTLNPEEALDQREAIFEIVYSKPELLAIHEVMTGIQMNTQIPFYGLLGLVGEADTGCGAKSSAEVVTTSQKNWDPKMIGFRLPHCQADVPQLFKMWKKANVAKDQWEKIDNAQVQFLTQRILDAVYESILRLSSFGDTAADNVSGGGVITNGVALKYFTPVDGLWKQIFTGVTATTITKIAITENSAVSKALQDTLASERAYNLLRSMYNSADSRLISQPNIKFQVTRSLYNNLQDYFEDKTMANGFTERSENGVAGMKYRGIDIVIRDDWDRNIRAYMDNGTTFDLPHRAILTPLANIPIGTSDEESMKSVEMFYDKKDRTHYSDVDYMIDVKVLEDYLIVVAY